MRAWGCGRGDMGVGTEVQDKPQGNRVWGSGCACWAARLARLLEGPVLGEPPGGQMAVPGPGESVCG